MGELELAILRRNARFRAWRAVGVPVEGCWVSSGESLALYLHCTEAGCHQGQRTAWRGTMGRPSRPGHLEEYERKQLRLMGRRPAPFACPHLAPLLGVDPEEVRDIAVLELIAHD